VITLEIELAYHEKIELVTGSGTLSPNQATNAANARKQLDKMYADACAWLDRRATPKPDGKIKKEGTS
jgi:hypothetical protein